MGDLDVSIDSIENNVRIGRSGLKSRGGWICSRVFWAPANAVIRKAMAVLHRHARLCWVLSPESCFVPRKFLIFVGFV